MQAALTKRILVVDDDPGVVELVRRCLPECEIAMVGDGEGAFKMATTFKPDLFIVDLILPGMRGTSLALQLQDSEAFARTPIFLLSALIGPLTINGEPVRVMGITAFPKPFNLQVFQKHVRLHLEDPAGAQMAVQNLERGWITGE